MSAFDLAGDHDSASLMDQARSNPLDLSQPVGFFTGAWKGPALGLGGLLTNVQRSTGLALGAVAGSFDLLTGDALKAQEKVFEHIVTPADKLSRHLAPKPEEIGMAGQLLHGLIKIGGEAVAFGAPGVLVNETVGGTLDALDKGVDLQTAGKVGGVQGAAMTAGVIAPMTLGATGLGMNVLYGAGINLAQGVFQRGMTSKIYEDAGRHDLALQFKALDGEAMAVDAILGAAFAGGGRALQLRGEKAKADAVAEYKAKISEMLAPEHIDAALVKNEQLKMERSGFGLPADLASRDAHVANLTGAIDDLMEGRPVTMREPVGDTIPDEAAAKVQADVAEVLRPAVEPVATDSATIHPMTADTTPRQNESSNGPAGATSAVENKTLARIPANSDASRVLIKFDGDKGIAIEPEGIVLHVSSVMRNFKGDVRNNILPRALDELFSPLAKDEFVRSSINVDDAKYLQNGDHKGSVNHADGEPEKFLDKNTGEWRSGLSVSKSAEFPAKTMYVVRGEKVGVGTDQEPLINPSSAAVVKTFKTSKSFYSWWNKQLAKKLDTLGISAEAYKNLRANLNTIFESEPAKNEPSAPGKVGAGDTAATPKESSAVAGDATRAPDAASIPLPDSIKPDAVIPLDDTDATTTVAEAQGIITDLETAAREQETGLRAAVACFLRAA